ncbi:CARDB domain-containing protein [Chloroflexota bacterium]
MKLSVLIAIILILTILPSCSSEAPVPLSPAPEETQATTRLPTLEETPTEFTISGLSVTPIKVKPNEEITISAEVTNTGSTEGTYVVILKINGLEESRKEITIEAGKSETVDFPVTRDKDGSYEVSIDDRVGKFTVIVPIPAYTPPALTPQKRSDNPRCYLPHSFPRKTFPVNFYLSYLVS